MKAKALVDLTQTQRKSGPFLAYLLPISILLKPGSIYLFFRHFVVVVVWSERKGRISKQKTAGREVETLPACKMEIG